MKYIYVLIFSCFLLTIVSAQDTTKKTIEITSSFKPVLRHTEKRSFQATPPPPDTIPPKLDYSIPVQNVIPRLTPVSLKPLSVALDTSSSRIMNHFVKAGFGNLRTPFFQAGISIPVQKTRFNLMADHISSSGKIADQDYSETNVKANATSTLHKNHVLDVFAGFEHEKYFLFGLDRTKFNYERSDLRQTFSTFSIGAGIRNDIPTEFGITYNPQIQFAFFRDHHQNNERNFNIKVPVEKFIGKSFGVRFGVEADFTGFNPHSSGTINNHLVQLPVSLRFRTPNLQFNAGLIPSWDNLSFKLLPDIEVNVPLSENKWILQGGWVSYFNKGDYRNLAAQNPYLAVPGALFNQRTIDRFIGFKGTLPNHITYNAKIGYLEFHNRPLFVNDTVSGKNFDILFEQLLKAIQVQAEIGYIKAERFSATARFNWYHFNEQKTADKAWGLIPIEFSTRLRWNLLKDLTVTTDLFLWDGPLYVYRNTGISGRSAGAADLNAGLEFKLTKKIFIWSQFHNILNSSYQRWNQYQNYGFNMLIGGIFRFNQ